MMFLADFSPIQPEVGMLFWAVLIFAIVWLFIGRSTFGPIGKALRERELSIESSLKAAEQARNDMASLQARNEELLKQAQEERSKILREAKEAKDQIIAEARDKAKEEASRIVASAAQQIENQKMAALTEVKNKAGVLAIEIAEKVLRRELGDKAGQESFAKSLVDDIKLN